MLAIRDNNVLQCRAWECSLIAEVAQSCGMHRWGLFKYGLDIGSISVRFVPFAVSH
jgi:hypothetical protein